MGLRKPKIESGVELPVLSNPAGAEQILSGYEAIDGSGNKVAGSIASQGAQTITPGTANKTITAGKYLSGTQTIKGDSNLKSENILKGVSIFGIAGSVAGVVTGSFDGGSFDNIQIDAIKGKSNWVLLGEYDSYNGYPQNNTQIMSYSIDGNVSGVGYNNGFSVGNGFACENNNGAFNCSLNYYKFKLTKYYYIAW